MDTLNIFFLIHPLPHPPACKYYFMWVYTTVYQKEFARNWNVFTGWYIIVTTVIWWKVSMLSIHLIIFTKFLLREQGLR